VVGARRPFCVCAIGRRPRASAAGATWTSRTTSAPWARRFGHTTVIDAAGAIYIIGGADGTDNLNDVWASTDGGARAGRVKQGYPRDTMGYYGVLSGY
jgi:hypothetical protein